jgi:hypothetical protein
VIEGEDLPARPIGNDGFDDPPGRTPGQWVAMGALRVGDVVLTREGRTTRVQAVETHPAAVAVYHFLVEDLHCYAVGADGVLVHNANCPHPSSPAVKTTSQAPTQPAVQQPTAPPQAPSGGGNGAPVGTHAGQAGANGPQSPV